MNLSVGHLSREGTKNGGWVPQTTSGATCLSFFHTTLKFQSLGARALYQSRLSLPHYTLSNSLSNNIRCVLELIQLEKVRGLCPFLFLSSLRTWCLPRYHTLPLSLQIKMVDWWRLTPDNLSRRDIRRTLTICHNELCEYPSPHHFLCTDTVHRP